MVAIEGREAIASSCDLAFSFFFCFVGCFNIGLECNSIGLTDFFIFHDHWMDGAKLLLSFWLLSQPLLVDILLDASDIF